MNAIEIKNISKHYRGFSLENLSLTLPSGCIMGLVGENGAGKSTTIRLILDMTRPDGGEITVFATGTLASAIRSSCRTPILYRKTLILDGLYAIWRRNTKA